MPDQRLLASLSMLNEGWHVAALPYLWHLQSQRPQSCVPAPLPMSVAVSGSLLHPFVRRGPDLLLYLLLHHEIQDQLCQRAHWIFRRTRGLHKLVGEFVPVYSVFGYPFVSSFRESWTLPLEPAAAGLCQDLKFTLRILHCLPEVCCWATSLDCRALNRKFICHRVGGAYCRLTTSLEAGQGLPGAIGGRILRRPEVRRGGMVCPSRSFRQPLF